MTQQRLPSLEDLELIYPEVPTAVISGQQTSEPCLAALGYEGANPERRLLGAFSKLCLKYFSSKSVRRYANSHHAVEKRKYWSLRNKAIYEIPIIVAAIVIYIRYLLGNDYVLGKAIISISLACSALLPTVLLTMKHGAWIQVTLEKYSGAVPPEVIAKIRLIKDQLPGVRFEVVYFRPITFPEAGGRERSRGYMALASYDGASCYFAAWDEGQVRL